MTTNKNIAFYVNSHPDDLELFMNKNVYKDIASGVKVVIITTTAGDAGFGVGNGNGVSPYYLAREKGHQLAIQFWNGLSGTEKGSLFTTEEVLILGKKIQKNKINDSDVIWYNMRLPDGGTGEGYPNSGYESLSKLLNDSIDSINNIEKSSNYTKSEFIAVLQEIVNIESSENNYVFVNVVEQDSGKNPGDHPDHKATSIFFTTAISSLDNHQFEIAYFTTYSNSNRAQNLFDNDLYIHIGTWGAVNAGLSAGGQANTWEPTHNSWLGRQYITTVHYP